LIDFCSGTTTKAQLTLSQRRFKQQDSNMKNPGNTGLRRIINAFFFSCAGFKAAWQNEAAFRQEGLLFIILAPLGFWLGQGPLDKSLLVGSLLLVLMVELLNSAVEAVVDRIGHEHHELSGRAKDIGSAAVLLALLNVGLIWGLYLYNYFLL
jgi:diacylglycerol kinase (ATP)